MTNRRFGPSFGAAIAARLRRVLGRYVSRYREWEYVPEGWARQSTDSRVTGWDVREVCESYRAKLPAFRSLLEGRGPIAAGTSPGTAIGTPSVREQNTVLAFAYALALASRKSDCVSILDWGGGIGFFYLLSKALLPPEVELEYHCKELPLLCSYGRRELPEVEVHEDETCLERSYDLVVASSSLQYSKDWTRVLDGLAAASRRYLYLGRVPVVLSSPSFVVLQRAYRYPLKTEYLSWVFNREELLDQCLRSRLELVQEFLLGFKPVVFGAPEQDETRGFLLSAGPTAPE